MAKSVQTGLAPAEDGRGRVLGSGARGRVRRAGRGNCRGDDAAGGGGAERARVARARDEVALRVELELHLARLGRWPAGPGPIVARPPDERAGPGSCDTHVHLLAAANEFPLYEGRAEDPPSGHTFQEWIRLYRRHLENLGCTRGVIVHSIFYGTDNSVTVAALREMGAGFRGIGLLPDQASEADLDQFVAWNMAGVRLNYVHGGVLSWKGAKAMAPKLADRGLHIQMLMHAHLHMNELQTDLQNLPVPVCFDHIGWPDLTLGTGNAGLEALYCMLDSGKVWIKLSVTCKNCFTTR